MKKTTRRIFVTQTGRYLCGSVEKRSQGRITTNGLAFVEIAADQSRFIFAPIKFTPGLFVLYESGLLGETEMPELMVPGYLEYLKTLKALPGKKTKKKR